MRPQGAALDAADEANKVIHLSWIQEGTRGMRVYADDELLVVDSGFATDTFNVVCRVRLPREASGERIRSVLRHFRSNGRPFAWWVGPADRPPDLGSILLKHGFAAAGTEPGVAADLEGLRSLSSVDASPGGLRIERARTEAQVRQFGEALAALADPPDPTVVKFYECAAPALLRPDSPRWLYVGYLGGEPVATAELTVGGGIVGLYNITTRTARHHHQNRATRTGHRHRDDGAAAPRRPRGGLRHRRPPGVRGGVSDLREARVRSHRKLHRVPAARRDLTAVRPMVSVSS